MATARVAPHSGPVGLVVHFNNGLDADAAGGSSIPFTLRRVSLDANGRSGSALRLGANEFISYRIRGNLTLARGTVSIWACPDRSLDNYFGQEEHHRQMLFAVNNRTGNRLQCWLDMTEATPRLRVRVGNGEETYIMGMPVTDWRAGQWRRVQVSWQRPSMLALRLDDGPWLEREIAPLPRIPDHMAYDLYVGSNATQRSGTPMGPPDRFHGRIDDLIVTDRRKSAVPTVRVLPSQPLDTPRSLPWAVPLPQRVQIRALESSKPWPNRPIRMALDLGRKWASQSAAQRRSAIRSLRLYQTNDASLAAENPDDYAIEVPIHIGPDSYDESQLHLGFRHRGDENTIYSLYFDPSPGGGTNEPPASSSPVAGRAMVGDGDRLRVGSRGSTGLLSGGIRGSVDAFDPDGDGDLDLWMNFGDQGRNNQDLRNGHFFYENIGGPGHDSVYAHPVLIAQHSTPMGVLLRTTVPQIIDVNADGRDDVFLYSPRGSQWWQWDFIDGRVHVTDYHELKVPEAGRSERGRLVDWNGDGQLDLVAGLTVYFGSQVPGEAPGFGHVPDVKLRIDSVETDNWESSPIGMLPVDFNGDDRYELLASGWPTELYLHQPLDMRERTTPVVQAMGYDAGKRLTTFDNHELRIPSVFPSPVTADFDRDGDLDLLWVNDGATVGWCENIAGPGVMPRLRQTVFLTQEDACVDSGAMAIPTAHDWDHDGDLDLIVGGASEYVWYFENVGSSDQPIWDQRVPMRAAGMPIALRAGRDGSLLGPQETDWGYTNPAVADWDRDGLDDLIVLGIRGEIHWFPNIGEPGRPSLASGRLIAFDPDISDPPTPSWVRYPRQSLELIVAHRSRPAYFDWNDDGWLDILTLDHESRWAIYPGRAARSTVSTPRVGLPEHQVELIDPHSRALVWNRRPLDHPNWKPHYAGRTVIQVTDWDNDGRMDLILDNVNARLYTPDVGRPSTTNQPRQLRWIDRGDLVEARLAKHNTGPFAADFDGDGKQDLIVGAESGRVFFFSRAYIEAGHVLTRVARIETGPLSE